MVKHKLISFANVIALWTLVTLLIKLIRVLPMWKYIQDLMFAILVAMLRKRLLSKKRCPGYRTGAYIWENLYPCYRDISRKNQPRNSYELIKISTQLRVARRDLGNRHSPVDRADMKRP